MGLFDALFGSQEKPEVHWDDLGFDLITFENGGVVDHVAYDPITTVEQEEEGQTKKPWWWPF